MEVGMKRLAGLVLLLFAVPASGQDKGLLLEDLTWCEAEEALTPVR
jgi:hypothetical protein